MSSNTQKVCSKSFCDGSSWSQHSVIENGVLASVFQQQIVGWFFGFFVFWFFLGFLQAAISAALESNGESIFKRAFQVFP